VSLTLDLSQFRVQHVAQPVPEEVHGERKGQKRQGREQQDPPFPGQDVLPADIDQRAEGRLVSSAHPRPGSSGSLPR
jgi:hypothetical protein